MCEPPAFVIYEAKISMKILFLVAVAGEGIQDVQGDVSQNYDK